MNRFISAEFFKLKTSKTFKILSIITVLLSIVGFSLLYVLSSESVMKDMMGGMSQEEKIIVQEQISKNASETPIFGGVGLQIASKDMFNPTGKEIFHSMFGAGLIEIILTVLIGSFVAKEYSVGTIKNMLSYGKPRSNYYIGKWLNLSMASLWFIVLLVTPGTLLATFLLKSGWGTRFTFNEFLHCVSAIFVVWCVAIAIVSFLMLISTIVKNSGTVIAIGIVCFAILPSLVAALYGKFEWFDFLFERTLYYDWIIATYIYSTQQDLIYTMVNSLCITVLCLFIGIQLLKRQDLK
ncbi:MAG: ABC transporter permease [Bacilli bacterium]